MGAASRALRCRCGSAGAVGVGAGAACGAATTAFCLAIEPVTESRSCSSTATREYSRSRSLLSVSTAEASRRPRSGFRCATVRSCCACRARSSDAARSSARAERRLVGEHGDDDRGDRADAPRSEPPHRAAVEFVLLGQKPTQQAAGVFGLEAIGQWVGISGHRTYRPSQGPPKSHHKHYQEKGIGLESRAIRRN